jgi:hypothetical protein
MKKNSRIGLSTMRWSKWSGGRWTPFTLVRGSLVVWLVALALVAAPAVFAASDADSGEQGTWSWIEAEYPYEDDDAGSGTAAASAEGTWSWIEAEYPYEEDGAAASSSTDEAVFDDDPAHGASSLAEAMFIAGLAGQDAADNTAGIAADPAANAWSLAEAEFIYVNEGQEAMSGLVYWVPDSFCSAC